MPRLTYRTIAPAIEQRLLELLALPEGSYQPKFGWNERLTPDPSDYIAAGLPEGSAVERLDDYEGWPVWRILTPYGPFMHKDRYRDEEGLWIDQTADQLVQWLQEQEHFEGASVSHDSVYKALQFLVDSGRWTKKKVGEGMTRRPVYRPVTP